MEERYFITVDWCNKEIRGIFCNRKGETFSKEIPHSQEEIDEHLDVFSIILNGKSEKFTKEEAKQFNRWRPLAEYKNQYGIALKSEKK